MSTPIFFNIIDSDSNPLVGSKVTLRPYSPPYFSGSSITYGGPISGLTDVTGNVYFNNVIPGIYKVSYTNVSIDGVILNNYAPTVFYINLSDTSGELVNGADYIVTPDVVT
jgi:hypothetical protein